MDEETSEQKEGYYECSKNVLHSCRACIDYAFEIPFLSGLIVSLHIYRYILVGQVLVCRDVFST